MFHAPLVNIASTLSIVPTHSSTSVPRIEDGRALSPTCIHHRSELRRVKKQKMERVRRARISDKIAQLHGLALSIVGVDAEASVRTEKVEMLGFCHEVLRSLHNLLVERPDMMERLKACHRGSTETSAMCPNTTSGPLTTSRIGCCEGGAYVPSISVPQSSSVESNGVNRTDCRLPLKKRQEVWRPYL